MNTRQFAYNVHMSIREQAKTESRTLARYIKGKLGIPLSEFSKLESTSASTLNDRWHSPEGKIRIMDAAFRMFIRRNKDLSESIRCFDAL